MDWLSTFSVSYVAYMGIKKTVVKTKPYMCKVNTQLQGSFWTLLNPTEEMSTSYWSQSETFLSYKYYNTAKGSVGMSSNGAVTFVSVL